MDTRRTLGTGLAAGALALSVITAASEASAANVQEHTWSDRDAQGNTFYGAYTWQGDARNYTATTPSGVERTSSEQNYDIDVKVFGKAFKAADVLSYAAAEHASGWSSYQTDEEIVIRLVGQTVYSSGTGHHACSGKPATNGCVSQTKTLAATLFQASAVFTIGPFPITVTSKVAGGATAIVSAATVSENLLANPKSFHGKATTRMSVGGTVWNKNSAEVGIPYVATVGIGVDFKLIQVNLGPDLTAEQTVALNSSNQVRGSRSLSVREDVDLSTMDGKVEVFVKLLGATVAQADIVTWDGYDWTGTWLNETLTSNL